MAKIEVTKALAETIRDLRNQYKVQAKDLAKALGKSSAYITKLEKGDIQNISKEELKTILSVISDNAEKPDSVAERIANLLNIKYTDEEIKEQIWYYNFDLVFRRIPVSEELIDFINDLINKNQLSRTVLFDRINSNEGLTEEDRKNDSIPHNTWYGTPSQLCIKLKLNWDIFNNVLDKKIKKTSYMYVYSALTYVYLFESEMKNIDSSLATCQNRAIKTMNDFKFYSLQEKSILLRRNETEQEKTDLLTSFDIENAKYINTILTGFKYLSDADIIIANERLKSFSENLQSDLGFMSRIISLDYKKLDNVSIEIKTNFLKALDKLIDEYSESTEDKINLY